MGWLLVGCAVGFLAFLVAPFVLGVVAAWFGYEATRSKTAESAGSAELVVGRQDKVVVAEDGEDDYTKPVEGCLDCASMGARCTGCLAGKMPRYG